MADVFGELRSLVQEPPGQEVFDAIWTLLRKKKAAQLEEEYLPYLRAHLERWPSGLRGVASRDQKPFFEPGEHNEALVALLSLVDTLHITHNSRLGDEEAAYLAEHPYLENIKVLKIENPRWSVRGMEALAQSPHLAGLTHLRLRNAVGPFQGFRTLLCDSTWSKNLTHLELSGWAVPENLDELFGGKTLANLESFHSQDTSVWSSELLAKLSEVKTWKNLHTIEIVGEIYTDTIGHEDHAAQLRPEGFPALRSLKIERHNQFYFELLLSQLEEAASALELTSLHITNTYIHEEDVHRFWTSELLSGLTELEVSDVSCEGEWFELLESANIPKLRELRLSELHLTDEGATHLAQNATLTDLNTLHVRGCKITAPGLLNLIQAPWSLSELDLGDNVIRRAEWDQIIEALGETTIRRVFAGSTHINDNQVLSLGKLSNLEELTFLPGDLSLHGIVDLCFSQDLRHQARENARAHAFAHIDRKKLLKILKGITSTTLTQRATHAQTMRTLVEETASQEMFARAICRPEYLEKLTKKQVKATLKRCKVSGYSKLRDKQALEELELTLMLDEADPLQLLSSDT